jgi:hypothetical protein
MPDQFQLDFTELDERDKAGYGFQALVADIGRLLGYEVEEGGTGPDRGRDLFFKVPYNGLPFKQEKKKWLVTCKDFAKSKRSVSRVDVQTAYADAVGFHCYGLLLVCTTNAGDDVVTLFNGWETDERTLRTQIWNKHNIQQLLHERENDFRLTLARYFPKSYGLSSRASDKVIDSLVELLKDAAIDEMIRHAIAITEADQDPIVRWRLAEVVLGKTPDLPDLLGLLRLWGADQRPDFKTALQSLLLDYFCSRDDYMNELGDELQPAIPTSFCGLCPGYTSGELSAIQLEIDNDDVLLNCTGTACVEMTDSVDKETGTMSFQCTITVRISEGGYEFEITYMENPVQADWEAEQDLDNYELA